MVQFCRPEASIGELAATLAWGLIRNHAFIDGNKRIGVICIIVFLHVDGYQLTCSQEEEAAMIVKAAASELAEEAWTPWVVSVIAALAAG